MLYLSLNVIGEKNNQTLVSSADREVTMDNAGNSVYLVSAYICLPFGLRFAVCIGLRCYILIVPILRIFMMIGWDICCTEENIHVQLQYKFLLCAN